MGIVTNRYQKMKPMQQQIPCRHYILVSTVYVFSKNSSLLCGHNLVNRLAVDPHLRMVFLYCIFVRGIKDAPDLVFFLAEKDVVMRNSEFVLWCILGFTKLLRI